MNAESPMKTQRSCLVFWLAFACLLGFARAEEPSSSSPLPSSRFLVTSAGPRALDPSLHNPIDWNENTNQAITPPAPATFKSVAAIMKNVGRNQLQPPVGVQDATIVRVPAELPLAAFFAEFCRLNEWRPYYDSVRRQLHLYSTKNPPAAEAFTDVTPDQHAGLRAALDAFGQWDKDHMWRYEEETLRLQVAGVPAFVYIVKDYLIALQEQSILDRHPPNSSSGGSVPESISSTLPYDDPASVSREEPPSVSKANQAESEAASTAEAGMPQADAAFSGTDRSLFPSAGEASFPGNAPQLMVFPLRHMSLQSKGLHLSKGLHVEKTDSQGAFADYSDEDVVVLLDSLIPKERKWGSGDQAIKLPYIQGDERTNSLLIYDEPRYRGIYQRIIAQLDVATEQIEISAAIVDIYQDSGGEWSMDLLFKGIETIESRPVPYVAGSNNRKFAGSTADVTGAFGLLDSVNLATKIPGQELGSQVLKMPGKDANSAILNPGLNAAGLLTGDNYALLARLRALETAGRAQFLARPSIVTLDNQTARLRDGTTAAVVVPSEYDPTLFTIGAGLVLHVTPHLIDDPESTGFRPGEARRVGLAIDLEDGTLSESPDGKATAVATQNRIITQVVVREGESLLIGGRFRHRQSQSQSGVPLLQRIPILGLPFKSKSIVSQRLQRFYLVTPRIIPSQGQPPFMAMESQSGASPKGGDENFAVQRARSAQSVPTNELPPWPSGQDTQIVRQDHNGLVRNDRLFPPAEDQLARVHAPQPDELRAPDKGAPAEPATKKPNFFKRLFGRK